ncbi:MAG: DUF4139 domain-containing protein [Thermoguttaceae bacterium]
MFRPLVCSAALLLATLATARAETTPATSLPLHRVVMFSSGVGFFEHAGSVNGDAKVSMLFKTADINDLLKSMVVRDLDGGQVSTITYGSKDPITKTLKSFPIDLTTNPSLAQLLGQVRGERVVLEAPDELSGTILGIETRKKRLNDHETIDVDVLNLLTDKGLRAVELPSVTNIKLANEKLDAELRKALAVLASAHAVDKKSVELSFLGKGTRRVRVGYIQQSPIWKTTYRLVLSDEKKPFLQGWAIVENTSEEDWNNVRLTLVSGRPISFTMDLYEPLYITRPEVELELYSSLRPQVYQQDMARGNAEFAAKVAGKLSDGYARGGREKSCSIVRGPLAGAGPTAPPPQEALAEEMGDDGLADRERLISTTSVSAQGGNVGNLFQYVIAMPVSLPRQRSAMLPIVNAEVKGEKVSIYSPGVHAKHPLYGLRFTNTTDLYLMQGPITVFDGDVYAGDAKIEDLPPGSQRLLSYGLDLDTEVAAKGLPRPEQLLGVRLIKGTMITTRKYVRSVEYTVKNSGKKAKTVLIEYPIDAAWKLIAPKKPTEETRELYRFAVTAKPGEPAKLGVEQERTERQQVAIDNLDDNAIRYFVSMKVVSQPVKAALGEVVKRKHEIEQVAAHRQELEQRIGQINEDQARIRQNMAQLDRTSDVYKSYVKKLSNQETEIEKLRGQTAELTAQENRLRKALDEYLMGLDLE